MWWDWGTFGGWWIVMVFLMILFWAAVLGFIIWLIIRLTRREPTGTAGRKTPLEIARERYARGEITREEFEDLKKDLS
jgi:putative membrane protein